MRLHSLLCSLLSPPPTPSCRRAMIKNVEGVCSDFQPPGCTSQSSFLADAVLTRCLTGTRLCARSYATDCRNSQPTSERHDGRKPHLRCLPEMSKWSPRENRAGELGTKWGRCRSIHITWKNASAEAISPFLFF